MTGAAMEGEELGSAGPDAPISDSADMPAIDLSPDAAALVAQLERERDESISARQRALADFANYQRRARDNEARARQEGEVSLLRALLPVIDHFDLAISQDPAKLTVEQLLGGVKIVRAEFDKVLESQGVVRIEPRPGDEFDPRRHEAMMRQPFPGIAANHVVALLQPGFAIGDMVLRPAKITVAPEE
jgi:molecular chaperone GrpE